MYFRVLYNEANGAATYLLGDLDAGEAVLIDARAADLAVLRAMLAEHRLTLRWLLRTHEHTAWRSPGEASALATLGCPVMLHRGPDAEVLPFGSEHLRALHTPGHTPECVTYAWRDRLFCGDALALDACPDQRAPARPDTLWDSVIHSLFTWPAETLLWSGHGRHGRLVSTVQEQRLTNPWFAGKTRDEFLGQFQDLAGHATPGAFHHASHHDDLTH